MWSHLARCEPNTICKWFNQFLRSKCLRLSIDYASSKLALSQFHGLGPHVYSILTVCKRWFTRYQCLRFRKNSKHFYAVNVVKWWKYVYFAADELQSDVSIGIPNKRFISIRGYRFLRCLHYDKLIPTIVYAIDAFTLSFSFIDLFAFNLFRCRFFCLALNRHRHNQSFIFFEQNFYHDIYERLLRPGWFWLCAMRLLSPMIVTLQTFRMHTIGLFV